MNLSPKQGEQVAQMTEAILNGKVLDIVRFSHDCTMVLGENNHMVEEYRKEFKNLSDVYNGTILEQSKLFRDNMTAFTDFADYISKLSVDTSVKIEDVGSVQGNNYDLARSL